MTGETFERGELNTNEIEKLRSLLETLKKTRTQGTCLVAFLGITSIPKLLTLVLLTIL